MARNSPIRGAAPTATPAPSAEELLASLEAAQAEESRLLAAEEAERAADAARDVSADVAVIERLTTPEEQAANLAALTATPGGMGPVTVNNVGVEPVVATQGAKPGEYQPTLIPGITRVDF